MHNMGNSGRDIISLCGVFLSSPYVVGMPQTVFQLSRRDLESKREVEESIDRSVGNMGNGRVVCLQRFFSVIPVSYANRPNDHRRWQIGCLKKKLYSIKRFSVKPLN